MGDGEGKPGYAGKRLTDQGSGVWPRATFARNPLGEREKVKGERDGSSIVGMPSSILLPPLDPLPFSLSPRTFVGTLSRERVYR
jgi:hypothetical protein